MALLQSIIFMVVGYLSFYSPSLQSICEMANRKMFNIKHHICVITFNLYDSNHMIISVQYNKRNTAWFLTVEKTFLYADKQVIARKEEN